MTKWQKKRVARILHPKGAIKMVCAMVNVIAHDEGHDKLTANGVIVSYPVQHLGDWIMVFQKAVHLK
jgi:hypothetical protein